MRKKLLLALFLCLGFLLALPHETKADIKELKKQIYKERVKDLKLGQGQMGRKFIIAIPPNEEPGFGWGNSAMEVYIASAIDVDLDLTILGSKKKEKLRGGEVLILNDENGLNKTAAEIREPNTATNKTITIEASGPVSVYVMNSKNLTSDGYMALPVDSWQKEYIHCSYYDNYENAGNKFASGFLVLGSQKNTKVEVTLRGEGSKSIATVKGRPDKSIGEEINFRINEGEVYQVEADGLTQGQFDLTGSSVSADKPIAIISYHWRAVIPIFATSSRDHLCAMPMPVATWGQTYASIALQRDGSKKGDLFRIIASEPDTRYFIKWYDFETKELISTKPGILKFKGDWNEYSSEKSLNATAQSITGTSVFTADKPVFIMQYSYSSDWDGADYDPFMWPVTPVEQYITGTIVQAPNNKAFAENYINIVAQHDTNDVEMKGLKSLMYDGRAIVDIVPSFTSNKIPETNLYWARFAINTGPHKIGSNGEAPFGGYIYGFKNVDSYGWPAAMALKNLGETDTVPPVLKVEGECGEWKVHVTELTIDPNENADPRQIDSKVWTEPAIIIRDSTLDNTYYNSYNISDVQYINNSGQPEDWKYEPHEDYWFTFSVVDKFKDAKCYFYVADNVGNISVDSVEYFADDLRIVEPDPIEFGKKQIMENHFIEVTFENAGKGVIALDEIELLENQYFSIVPDELDYNLSQLEPGKKMTLKLQYSPIKEIEDKDDFDLDSILFKTECLEFSWPITGQGVTPKIKVDDWIMTTPVLPGDTKEKTDGIIISNPGSAPLVISAYNFEMNVSEFEFVPDKSFPLVIQPKMFDKDAWQVKIEGEFFKPLTEGDFNDNLVFSSNAFDPDGKNDSVSVWEGFSRIGSVVLSPFDFNMLHVGTLDNTGTVTVTNIGTEAVVVTKLRFYDNNDPLNANFKFINEKGANTLDKLVNEITISAKDGKLEAKNDSDSDELSFKVAFTPALESAMSVRIVADYYNVIDDTKTSKESTPAALTGRGILPDIDVSEQTFATTAPGIDITEAEELPIYIKNSDDFESLIVEDISIDDPNGTNEEDFILTKIDGSPFKSDMYPISIAPGEQLEVMYAFVPKVLKMDKGLDPNNNAKGFIYSANIIVEANHVEGNGDKQKPYFEVIPADFIQNEVNPNEEEGYLKGFVVEGEAANTGADMGYMMRCETAEKMVLLQNLSKSQILIIKDIVISDDLNGVFTIPADVKAALIGSEIPMSTDIITESKKCPVIFDPSLVDRDSYESANGMTLDFSAKIHMIYAFKDSPDLKETIAQNLTASAGLQMVDISQKIDIVSNNSSTVPIQPGMYSYNIGDNAPHYTNYFYIDIADVKYWNELDIDTLTIAYKYKKDWMGIVQSSQVFDLNAGLGFDAVKLGTVEEGQYFIDTYQISASDPTTNFLSYDDKTAAILNPHFLLYLSSDTKYLPEITEVSFGNRDECIVYTSSTEEIPLNNCIQDINLISSSGAENLAPSLAPNPVVSSNATITYGLALNAQASLKLYNEEGKVVKVIIDSYQDAGTHTIEMSTEDLPNGVYIMRLEQNTFIGEGSMVISK